MGIKDKEKYLQDIIYEAICEIENGEEDVDKIYQILMKIDDLSDKEIARDVANEYLG